MTAAQCTSIRRQLAWFVGEDLDRDRAREVAAHLAECLDCRREASSLQQSHKALTRLRAVAPAGVDGAMFESLQRETLTAVSRAVIAEGERAPAMPAMARALWLAAAGLLFGLGWWSVQGPEGPSWVDRQPIPMATVTSGPTAQPWAGQRAALTPLGFDEDGANSELGAGMMTRWSLRTLEDELLDPIRGR